MGRRRGHPDRLLASWRLCTAIGPSRSFLRRCYHGWRSAASRNRIRNCPQMDAVMANGFEQEHTEITENALCCLCLLLLTSSFAFKSIEALPVEVEWSCRCGRMVLRHCPLLFSILNSQFAVFIPPPSGANITSAKTMPPTDTIFPFISRILGENIRTYGIMRGVRYEYTASGAASGWMGAARGSSNKARMEDGGWRMKKRGNKAVGTNRLQTDFGPASYKRSAGTANGMVKYWDPESRHSNTPTLQVFQSQIKVNKGG